MSRTNNISAIDALSTFLDTLRDLQYTPEEVKAAIVYFAAPGPVAVGEAALEALRDLLDMVVLPNRKRIGAEFGSPADLAIGKAKKVAEGVTPACYRATPPGGAGGEVGARINLDAFTDLALLRESDTLQSIAEHLDVLLASAQQHHDGEVITGYTIKTGALHRIIGLLVGRGFRVIVPATPAAEQGDAKDARFLHWTTDVGYVEIWLSKIDHLGFVQPISGPWRCPADFAVAILAGKPTAGEVGL